MKKYTSIALLALLVLPVARAAEEPAKLEKIMVTGSLAEPADAPAKLEKIMVTGSRLPVAKAPSRPVFKR